LSTTLQFNDANLIPAIAQDRLTGQVRMFAWMNPESLKLTLATGRATFYSRSRKRLWVKGESSGNALAVASIHADCDEDVLLLLVDPQGPSCHTGQPTCFFRRLDTEGNCSSEVVPARAFLEELEAELLLRQNSLASKSYTRQLLDSGSGKIGEKLREEAGELAEAIAVESDERVASEAADLLYHLLVGLRLRDIPLREVIEVLARRSGISGLAEKANRPSTPDS